MTEFSPSPSEPPQTVLATDSALRAVQQRRPGSSHTMTIEELATQVGMTVRNIRAYNSAGLLPPPTLRGRLGLYGEEHLAQLQAIRMLRNQGLSLERIKAVVEQNNRNEASGAWNKLGDLARVLSWHIPVDQEALRLPLSTIEATWRADFTPAQTEQLVRSGLQRILPDGSIEYLTPGLRAVAQQLSDMGVPLDDALEMQEAVSRDLRRLVRSSLRTVLQEAGRRLSVFLSRRRRQAELERKHSYISLYLPHLALGLKTILELNDKDESRILSNLRKMLERSHLET